MRRFISILVGLSILCLTSCTQLKAYFGNNEAILELATKAATARLLAEKPQWKIPAANITNVAIKAIDTNQLTTLPGLTQMVVLQIPMSKLLPEERALVSVFISQISAVITQELQKQGVSDPAKQLVEVRKVLSWINAVALMP